MLIKNATIIDEEFNVKNNVDVHIKNDRIEWIANSDTDTDTIDKQSGGSDMDAVNADEIIDGSNLIMMPGFFNSHGHSPMTLMRGYGENMTLQDWLFNRIFPFEDKLTPEAVYYGTLLSMAESFKYGIISTSDMYYFVDDMVRAVSESGAKANISRALANPTGLPFDELPSVSEMRDALNKYSINSGKASNAKTSNAKTFNDRIIIEAALHAEYTSNEDTAIKLSEFARDNNLRMHVHVSETKNEHDECKDRHQGRTPVKYLSDAGIFDVPAIAAHCVWIEGDDYKILAEKGVTVATNPVSNLKLASGICDVKGLTEAGVRVSIGTDSVASNNNLSMFEEMKTMMLLAKVKNFDPTLISPREAMIMATRNGALAQGRDDSGLIKEGYKADFILLKKNSPNMQPCHDLLTNIVLSATDSDIYMTVIDGKIVYRDGTFTTINIEEVIAGANKATKDILSRLN